MTRHENSRVRRQRIRAVLLLVTASACGPTDAPESGDRADGGAPRVRAEPGGGSVVDAGEPIEEPPDGGIHDGGLRDASVPDAGRSPGEPGMPCDATRGCEDGLRCVYLGVEHTVGYCAPTCTELHRGCGFFGPGVHAECTFELDDGTLVCGFVCILDHGDHTHDYMCPSGEWGRLRCERSSRAFNHRYCAPVQE